MADFPPTEGTSRSSDHVLREARQLAFDELFRTPQAEHSLAIDHAFPERFVDELSRREMFNKHLFRPNTYLHKWWARRCGSTFRAILKQFVPSGDRRDYYAPGGLEGRIVLDPMMGGGTTLHEAIRYWDPNAWAELTIALKDAGFRLMNAYVVFSEHPISVHIRNLNSIKHDSVLVFALDGDGPTVPWSPLEAIDTTDSETFCRQCSVTLGWLLESEYSPAEIRGVWKELTWHA